MESMRRVYQRYCNDCVVAAVAMATGVPYKRALSVAKSKGFKPGKKKHGLHIHKLLDWLGFTYEETIEIEDVQRPGPDIYLFPAPDGSSDWHCAVMFESDLYDPSMCSSLTIKYVIYESAFRYSEIKPK